MPELMLKPGWTGGRFQRTVTVEGKEPKVLVFLKDQPVEVSKEEMELLAPEIGLVIWPIERDDKQRPRYVEAPMDPAHKPKAAKKEVSKAEPHKMAHKKE